MALRDSRQPGRAARPTCPSRKSWAQVNASAQAASGWPGSRYAWLSGCAGGFSKGGGGGRQAGPGALGLSGSRETPTQLQATRLWRRFGAHRALPLLAGDLGRRDSVASHTRGAQQCQCGVKGSVGQALKGPGAAEPPEWPCPFPTASPAAAQPSLSCPPPPPTGICRASQGPLTHNRACPWPVAN